MSSALELLKLGKPVPRGCVQALFTYEAFNEVVRLGLQADTVARIRSERPDETGMLRVEKVCPSPLYPGCDSRWLWCWRDGRSS